MVMPGTLAERMRGGCPEAFRELVRAHERRLYSIAYTMTRNQQDALDVVQEALLAAHRARATLAEDTKMEAWLCAIVVNHARMLLRTRRRRPTLPLDEVEGRFDEDGHREGWLRSWALDPHDAAARAQLLERLATCAMDLPELYHEVWVLADVEQLSMREVADVLGIGVPTVKTRLHRARLALREALCAAVGET